MVFCCCGSTLDQPEQDGVIVYGTSKEAAQNGVYPGQRRLVKTAGNALVDAPDYSANISSSPSSDTMVAVKIPAGVLPGDTIAVKSPDGRRTVNATVPSGLTTGQTFMVRFPPSAPPSHIPHQPVKPIIQPHLASQQKTPTFAQALDAFMTQLDHAATPLPDPIPTHPNKTALSPDGKHASDHTREHEIKSYSFPENVDHILSPDPPLTQQKYLLVNIPPGTRPGTTIHVQVPGENRTLAAEVPPGVTSFRVAYTPRNAVPPRPQQHQTQADYSKQQPPEGDDCHDQVDSTRAMGQKLLSVQIPPGTRPGATLHVAVPDEPGRILAAQVPPGNLRQFHVAYVPRTLRQQTSQQGFMPMADPYNPGPRASTYQHQVTTPYRHGQSSSNNTTPAFNPEYNNNINYQRNNNNITSSYHRGGQEERGRSMADFALPAIGAAALGTAAFATYEHFAHQQQRQDEDGGVDDY
ncbi:hypothetical protein ACA910_010779 [Epithemia clementina (nom. ined.)]